jgi:cell division protein FtsQ
MNAAARRFSTGGIALKLAAWLAALALVALPIIGVMQGWFASDRWPFKQLRVDAAFERVNVDQIRSAAAPHLAVGFFAVDLRAVQRAVESVPWVERAEVRKHWPDLLEIRVLERTAAAAWGADRLVSSTGDLFAVPGNTMPQGLPQLTGPDSRAAEVLAFFGDITRRMTDRPFKPQALALSGRGSWTLTFDTGAVVVIGREEPQERLQRFLDALGRTDSALGAELARADLRYANGFAIRWQAAAIPALPVDAPPASMPDGAEPPALNAPEAAPALDTDTTTAPPQTQA